MKRVIAGLMFLAWIAAGAGVTAARAQSGMSGYPDAPGGQVSIGYFYDNLSDDGEWFQDSRYGWCWTPYDLTAEWRPYSLGHWEYTDYGWSWASDERFGWATYHYGRWFFDDSYGWAWVPGDEWAPAWVAWRTGDNYIGWAPLPPGANWDATAGLAFSDNDADAIPSRDWAFVPRQHLMDVRLSIQLTSVARNITLFGQSRNSTRFVVREGRPANMGFDVDRYEAALGHPIQRVRIVDATSPANARGNGNIDRRGTVGYFRPRIQPMPATQVQAPQPPTPRVAIPDDLMKRQRDERARKLESDLSGERARLEREHQNEIRSQQAGAAAEEMRKRQASEQQAFEAHAAQQRQVLEQRMQRKVVRPPVVTRPAKDNARPENARQDKQDKKDKQDKQDKKDKKDK